MTPRTGDPRGIAHRLVDIAAGGPAPDRIHAARARSDSRVLYTR